MGEKNDDVRTKSSLKNGAAMVILSHIEPKNIDEALKDKDWILKMEED